MTSARLQPGRRTLFWIACAAIGAGVLLHVPMLVAAHRMNNRLAGMPVDTAMWTGMALIALGVPLAIYGGLPRRRSERMSGPAAIYEAPDSTPFGLWHSGVLLVLILGLVIDVMKPATLGFVLPGLTMEYGITRTTAAWLPFVALAGTAIGSFLWGWLADAYGRRTSILLSTILFVSTAICGAMPWFGLNLLMCFLMGASAGGMLPVVYTLLAELMPPRHRSWVLVLVGGTGLVGGYLAASAAAHAFEPLFGWRALWLQGFPTGIALLLLAGLIPESPSFLAAQGRTAELERIEKRFGIIRRTPVPVEPRAAVAGYRHRRLTAALIVTALAWSFINFGFLLWLPSDLQQRGYSSTLASGILARSALLALPTITVAALLYARWSSKWTLVIMIALTVTGLGGRLLPGPWLADDMVVVAIITLLIVGSNGMIAVLLPYAAENYPLPVRGRATGLIAASSKLGGVAVQGFALSGLIPTLASGAVVLLAPLVLAAGMVAYAGRETRGRSLGELDAQIA